MSIRITADNRWYTQIRIICKRFNKRNIYKDMGYVEGKSRGNWWSWPHSGPMQWEEGAVVETQEEES